MPPLITIDVNEKAKDKEAINHAPRVRIYYADAGTNKWSYAGIEGALVFALNISNNTLHFWIVDLYEAGRVIWNYELQDGLVLHQEESVPFFISFQGNVGDDVGCGFNYYLFITDRISRNVGLVLPS
jgi:hypothetical protein